MKNQLRKFRCTLWLVLVASAVAGCSTVHTHLAPSELRPESVRGVYRGTKQIGVVTRLVASSKNRKAKAFLAATFPLLACDFVLSAVADTVILPYDALARDDATACRNAEPVATQPMNTPPDHKSRAIRRVR